MAAEITYRKIVKIGNTTHQFDVKGENLHDVIKPLSFGNVNNCGICEDTNLRLGTHVAKGKFKYTTIKCGKCGASLNFGQPSQFHQIGIELIGVPGKKGDEEVLRLAQGALKAIGLKNYKIDYLLLKKNLEDDVLEGLMGDLHLTEKLSDQKYLLYKTFL